MALKNFVLDEKKQKSGRATSQDTKRKCGVPTTKVFGYFSEPQLSTFLQKGT